VFREQASLPPARSASTQCPSFARFGVLAISLAGATPSGVNQVTYGELGGQGAGASAEGVADDSDAMGSRFVLP
jgi:hypothetical protein